MLTLVSPSATDRELFARMVQLYIYDFTELVPDAIGPDGWYPTPTCFDEMWTDSERYPRIIMLESEPAGFALVQRIGADNFDMEQFFILRKFRRAGIGRRAAHMLFGAFSGNWTVRQISSNHAAQAFWRSAIDGYTHGDFQETHDAGPKQSFVS